MFICELFLLTYFKPAASEELLTIYATALCYNTGHYIFCRKYYYYRRPIGDPSETNMPHRRPIRDRQAL